MCSEERTKRSVDFDIPYVAQCTFQDCVMDVVKIFPMRNAFPPIRAWRRYVGLDSVPIVEKVDKSESYLEKVKENHEETMKKLRSKLGKLQRRQGIEEGLHPL